MGAPKCSFTNPGRCSWFRYGSRFRARSHSSFPANSEERQERAASDLAMVHQRDSNPSVSERTPPVPFSLRKRTSDQVRVAGLKESRAGHHVEELGPTAERLANSSPMSLITPTMRAFPMRNALRPGFMSPTSVHPAGNPFSSSRFRRYQHRVLTDRIYRGPLSDWVSICTQISDLKVAWRFNLPICTTFAALGVAAR